LHDIKQVLNLFLGGGSIAGRGGGLLPEGCGGCEKDKCQGNTKMLHKFLREAYQITSTG
jgi:hypothetical protein